MSHVSKLKKKEKKIKEKEIRKVKQKKGKGQFLGQTDNEGEKGSEKERDRIEG